MIPDKLTKFVLLIGVHFRFAVEDIDEVEVVKVFAVETSEDYHAATNECGTMSSSGLRMVSNVSCDLQSFQTVILDINH